MGYGPGHSVPVWREYFGNIDLELWMAEYDAKCAAGWVKVNGALANVVSGDQADPQVLQRWINETGGEFDIVVDDGGHTWSQMTNSFRYLWPVLRPGGVYFIEDLVCAGQDKYQDAPADQNPLEWIKQYIETIATRYGSPTNPQMDLKTISCTMGICAFEKCHELDNGVDGPLCN